MQVFGDLQSHNFSFQHETADLSPVGEADVVVDRIMESCPQPRVLRLHCARIEIMRVAWKKPAELKQPNGHLAIRWRLETMGESGKPWLQLDWKESGVEMPSVGGNPKGTGQGRELIERALPYQFDAQTTFAMEPDGVHCTISLPVSELTLPGKP